LFSDHIYRTSFATLARHMRHRPGLSSDTELVTYNSGANTIARIYELAATWLGTNWCSQCNKT